MSVELRVGGGWLTLVGPGVVGERRRLDEAAVEQLRGFVETYRALLGKGEAQAQLLALGRQLYGWLDGEEHWLQRVGSARPLVLELRAPDQPDASEWTALHAPWELLADERGFLAQDAGLSFCPVRRLGEPTAAPPLPDWRLGLVFMAGAPRGQVELDYENEESAILEAAGERGIDLVVEDSGNPELLAERLGELEAMPVLHLSCHGHNAFRPTPPAAPRPVLMLEDDEGGPLPTEAGTLVQTLGVHEPRLLALSACLTTVAAAGGNGASAGEVADSLATALVRAGLPAVLGWEGSVSDKEATAFARELYGQLGNRQPLAQGVSVARQRLLSDPERPSRDWHLARLWLGPEGGGPIVGGRRKRTLVAPDRGFREFLDKKGQRSPVASREAFVGRRREIQTGLKILRRQDHPGVLIHGMGRSGKSSLAARLASRLGDGYALAVVYRECDALSVFEGLYEAVDRHKAARDLLEGERERVLKNPAALQGVLLDLLTGPCAQKTQDGRPVLLVIDDLEQILEEPVSGGKHTVKAAALPVLRTVLRAFDPQETDSRLLLTSRYTFTLPDGGKDLADKLCDLQLPPMREGAQRKLTLRMQQRARTEPEGATLSEEDVAARRPLLDRVQAIGRGNPGLQDLLAGMVLAPGAEAGQVGQTLAEMEAYLARGDLPQEATVRAFLDGLALDRLVGLASAGARELLRRATLFEVPVPVEVLEQLGDDGTADVQQLQGLGLLDRFEDLVEPGRPAAEVNALARPKAGKLLDSERGEYAKRVLPALFQAWGGSAARQQRPYGADLELTRLGLLADNPDVLEACAAGAVAALQSTFAYSEAGSLGQQVIEALDRASRPPPVDLLRRTGETCVTIGEIDVAHKLYERGLAVHATAKSQDRPLDPLDESALLVAQARLLAQRGKSDTALSLFEHAKAIAEQQGEISSAAIILGDIADILFAHGQLDEALRIRQEEQLPVFRQLGDVHEIALCQGRIADILFARGELDEALRIRQQEELPIYRQLGEVRDLAITQGRIADILFARGQLDEAMRIFRDEALPLAEQLRDVRSIAVCQGKIADILFARGQPDDALRILRDESLPLFEQVGDMRSIAVCQGKIADILFARGQLDEALRIRQEKELPVYRQLGDVRDLAICQGKIADILFARGQLDDALRILREESLRLFDQLGDVHAIAVCRGRIADILFARGQLDDALRIRQEDELPVYRQLGDVHSMAVTYGRIADIFYARGQLDEALRIRREDQLPVCQKLSDQEGIAFARWGIAQIERARGNDADALLQIREAYEIVTRVGRLEGICVIGSTLGQLLVAAGERDQGLAALRRSSDAYRQLGRSAAAEQVEVTIRQIEQGDAASDV